MDEISPKDKWLTFAEAAKLLGVDPRTLEKAIVQNGVPVVKIGKGARVTLNDLEKMKSPILEGLLLDGITLGSLEGEDLVTPDSPLGKIINLTGDSPLHSTVLASLVGGKISSKLNRTIVVDLNFVDGVLGFIHGVSSPTLINLAVNGISEETVKDTVTNVAAFPMYLMLAPKRPRDVSPVPLDRVEDLLRTLSGMYDYVVVVTPAYGDRDILEKVQEMSDSIVYTVEPVITSIFSMTKWLMENYRSYEDRKNAVLRGKLGIAVVNATTDISMPLESIERSALEFPILTVIPDVGKDYFKSVNIQRIDQLLQKNDFSAAVERLCTAISPTWEMSWTAREAVAHLEG